MDRPADFAERQIKNVYRDTDRHERIEQYSVIDEDERVARNHGYRCECVGQIVKEERPDIHAPILHRIDQEGCKLCNDQRNTAKNNDRPATNGGRISDPYDSLIDQMAMETRRSSLAGSRSS